MKYKINAGVGKKNAGGGDNWRGESFADRLRLTEYQTSYHAFTSTVPPCTVLEAGCGIGGWLIPLSERGYDVYGLELEMEALQAMRQNYAPTLRLTNGSLFSMPFEDASFDAVTSLGVLEHFEEESMVDDALREHHRVLRSDGTFFVTVPLFNIFRAVTHLPKRMLLTLLRRVTGRHEFFYEYRYTEREFGRLIERNGFVVTTVFYDDCIPPYNIGLWVDFKMFHEGTASFRVNRCGAGLFAIFSRMHPKLISGAVGFVCRKQK